MLEKPFVFGSFVLNPGNGELLCEGEPVSLGYKAQRLLMALLERAGEIVTKSDLLEAAWQGAVVEEGNLSVQVASLRKLLGKTSTGTDWIATIPRVGYRFVGPVSRSSSDSSKPRDQSIAIELASGPSIAVLPFKNLSDDPAQDYFADGLVEELVIDLSKMPGLFVIARNSTAAYKGKAADIRDIAKALGVHYVLEGSVRKFEGRVRITGQLVEGTNGTHVWADKFEGSLEDIFGLQDQLADSIVGALEPNLRRAEIERSRNKRPEGLDAYDFYLRALPHAFDNTLVENDEAIRLLNKSLSLDPNYAPAHAHAAWCHEQRYFRGGFQEHDRIAVLEHAKFVIEFGADNIQAFSIAVFVQGTITHDFESAIRMLDPALKANSNSALAFGFSALQHACNKDYEGAIEHAHKALRLSPSDPLNYHPNLALASSYLFTGRFEEAVQYVSPIIQAKPNFSIPFTILITSQLSLNREHLARAAAHRLMEIAPTFTIGDFVRADYWGSEQMQMIAVALRKMNLPE
jgi:adenylate cyclase